MGTVSLIKCHSFNSQETDKQAGNGQIWCFYSIPVYIKVLVCGHGPPPVLQVSVDAVRQLDRSLFEAYIERRADPIAGSLEPGIYAGYFDWRDCQTPTGTERLLPSL